MASLCLPPGTNWCPSRVDVSAPGAAVVRRRRCPRSHFGLYDDFNPNSITPTSLNPRAAERRGDGTCFLRAPSSFSLSLKLTSSSFKLGAGNDLGVATPMLLLLYARCLAARSADGRGHPVQQSLSKCGLLREEDVIHLRNGRATKGSGPAAAEDLC